MDCRSECHKSGEDEARASAVKASSTRDVSGAEVLTPLLTSWLVSWLEGEEKEKEKEKEKGHTWIED